MTTTVTIKAHYIHPDQAVKITPVENGVEQEYGGALLTEANQEATISVWANHDVKIAEVANKKDEE